MNVPPLEFEPRLLHTLWGGKKLYALKQLAEKNFTIGESWEISPMAEIPSVVASSGGELAGMSLPMVMQRYGKEIMGEALCEKYGNKFPLLIKFIDAEQDLSVQVHPGKSDETAKSKRVSINAKNEIWYIMDAQPDTEIIYGLSQDTTPHELINCAIEGTLFELLRKVSVSPGQIYDNPAGTIHAIGKGNLILEIQQPIDVTYRLWDYDRIDEQTGNKRPLHLTEAVEAAILTRSTKRDIPYRALPNSTILILEKEFAVLEKVWVSQQKFTYKPPYSESFVILVGLSGECNVLTKEGTDISMKRGKTVLFPKSKYPLTVSNPLGDGVLLAISLPAPY